ncbi:DNA mismatch repair protein MutS [Candidatus Woesearchaeota archaeon CG10_big_fil_rev_8_21_14_0_10_45_16]|nr:MAG: DNA mismatch repair protein MutS [Candidatus Woesearchaeota archaeon CG10_big_fil_rev_8_21_14_0_10_45_16]
MQQYLDAKKANPDCLIMLRMGDFYEMFYQDAVTASKELDITLTARGQGERRAPLAGIPYHALESYLGRLVKKGHKVAIIEQLEDPKKAKGLVKRGLVRIVTPGTLIESSLLDEKENNYVFSMKVLGDDIAAAFCDMSTGEFFTTVHKSLPALLGDIVRFHPSEGILPESLLVDTELVEKIRQLDCFVNSLDDHHFKTEKAAEILKEHFNLASLDSFGIEDKNSISAAGGLLYYLRSTQKNGLSHIKSLSSRSNQETMLLDGSTFRNLELLRNIRDSGSRGTVLSILDKTVTVLGSRLLKAWLKTPLCNRQRIEQRLDAVEQLHKNIIIREEIRELLKEVYDLERLISRINYGNASPKDLLALRQSLEKIPLLKQKTINLDSSLLQNISSMADLHEIRGLLGSAIKDDAPFTVREGGIIKPEFDQELASLVSIKENGRQYLQELERREKEKTGISSLKISYNKVFGYYIEVTKKNLSLVPEHYIRKQTTANGERYITEELKLEEEKILGAQEKIAELEYRLFQDIVARIAARTAEVQETARKVAALDVLCSLAKISAENHYVRPRFVDDNILHIKRGRHPVVEQLESRFIANDVLLDEGQMMIITGPNMAGKCLVGESIVFTDKGMIPIEDFKPALIETGQFYPLQVGVNGVEGLETASHFYYDGKRKTIRLKTRFGYEIEGTENHPVLVRTMEGKEIWRKLGNIQEQDQIIINRKIDLWGKNVKISPKILSEMRQGKYHHNVLFYKVPELIDEDLAYLIGLLVGDGTLTYKNSITFSNIDTELIAEFFRIMEDKFGYSPKTKKNNTDHLVCSRHIRSFFEKIGLGYVNSLDKETPRCILEAPKHIVRMFLQGLFDTDGCADKRYGNVSVSTSSYKLARQIQIILLNFGIISSLKPKKTSRNLNYRVQIYGQDSILFHNTVGFKLRRKSARSDKSSSLRMPNYGVPHLKEALKRIQKEIVGRKDKIVALKKVKKINSIFYTYLPNNRNISHQKLKELIDYCDLNRISCPDMKKISERNYLYDPIASIEASEAMKDVYDFSVPGTHSFTANGLINHNSTIMRQTALIVLLAQMGSFVPAEEATLGVIDRIFTRVGAYDDLSSGQSTFMVEMSETASILGNATEKSLVILDEIGRGTSTFDGVSIAWSVAEHIHNTVKAKTLFATHYHVMNKLADNFSRIKNYTIAVREKEGDVIFLHKLVEGSTDQSYGIHVAKLAGLPGSVVERAKEIQTLLEKDDEMIRRIKAKKIQEQTSLENFKDKI